MVLLQEFLAALGLGSHPHFRPRAPVDSQRRQPLRATMVREGIEEDWPYIFTDLEFEPAIERRFAKIKEGFDKIRERTPKR